MMMAVRRKAPLFGLAALTLVLGGCAGGGLGTLGEVLGGVLTPAGGAGQQGQVRVEIQGVDTQRQTIDVRTEDGQSGSVLFDQNTVVVYRQEQYSPAALVLTMTVPPGAVASAACDRRLYMTRCNNSASQRTRGVSTA